MDRTTLLSYLRQNNPNKADYSDDELLWETAKQAETDGIIGKYPVLQNEILRQRAALEAQDRGLIGNAWAATKRGFAQGAQGMNALGGVDETDAKDVAGWEQTKIANPNSPEFVEFMQAKGFKDSAKAFFKSPVRIISEVMAESAAGSLPALGAGFAGGTIQGAIAGGGTPAEAVTIPVGAMIGTAVGSGTVEYASKVLEVMQSEGMDISDPASIQKFFDDPDRLARAREHAVKKAIPVALFDGATVGLASKFGGKGLRNIAKGIGSEATGGMAGEYLGQQLAGEDTDWKSVAMEGIAEVGSLPGDLASTWRASNAAPVAKTNIMQPEAKPEAVATPLGVSFPEIRNTAPAAPATPAETSAIPTPVPTVEQPAKERPVLADFATQKALVEAGVRADEAPLYTQDEANGFLEEFANMQANAEQEVQDAAIEVAAQQQAVARAEAKANGAQMQETHRLLAAQANAEQQNLIAQEKAAREQRMAQIQAKQAQLAAQRSEVDSLADNPQPLLPFIESRTPMRGTGPSRSVDIPAVAKKQMAMRTDKLAAEIAAANKATPTVQTTPLTGKLETPSTEFSIPQVKIESPVAPSVAQEPVTAPQDAPQVAAKPRFRDELTAPEQTVLLDRSRVLDPNQSLESVLGEYGMANRLLGGRSHSNQLLVLKDKDGKFYQVPVKRKNLRGSFETVVMPYATKQTYLSWLSEEFGGTARRALFGTLKDKATTQKVLERAKEFGHDERFDPEVRTWLNKNQNLTPVMLLETKERVNSGFRPASDEMAGRIERELLGRRNREVESDVVVTDTIGKKFAVKIGSKEYTVVRDSEAKTWKLDGGEALGATKPAAVEALKSKYGFKDTVHELPPVAPSVAQEPITQRTPELPKVAPVSPMHRGLTVTDPSKAGRTLAAALYNTVFKKKGPDVWNQVGRTAIRNGEFFMKGINKVAAKDPKVAQLLTSLNTETDRDAVVLHGQEALYRMLNRLAEDNGHVLDFDENEIAADRFESKQDDRATSDIEAKEAKGDLHEGGMSVIRRHVESSADYLDATDRYNEVLDLTRQRGISVMQTEAAKAMREGGAYNVSNRTVSLTLRDVLRPSRSNLISLVHEVVHDITETAPEYVRMALHDAFDRLDAKKLAFYGKALAGENAMSSVTERMVEHLTFKGVDADYSRSILATVYRTVKDLILRGAQFLQSKMVGKENTSGTLATAWAENRVAMFLSGDDAKIGDFLDQFRTPSVGVLVRAVGGETFFNASTGTTRYERIEHLDAAPLNVQAAADAVIRTAKMTGQWTLGQDATALGLLEHVEPDAQRIGSLVVQATRKEARIASAAANSINAIMKQLFDRVKKSEPEYTSAQLKALKRLGDLPAKPVEDLTALYRLIGVSNPTNAKAGAIAKLKSILQEEFGQAPDGPIFDEGAQVDTLEGAELAGANKSIYRWTSSVDAKVRARIIELRDQLTDLEQSEPLRRAEIQAIYSQLGDSKVSYAAMVRNISETIESLRRDLRKTNDVSETLGEATSTLAALEDASDRQTLNQKYTEKALDGVSVNDVPLGSALKALYDLGIDLQSASPKEIRDRVREEVLINEDSPLAAFIRSDLRGTALLASMIRFVKNDALVAETIRAQMSRSKEDLAQLNEARDIWLASSDREVDEAREALKQLRPTGDAAKLGEQPAMTPRLAHRMINVLDENLARQAEIAKVRRDLEVLRSAQPAFTQLNRQAAQRLKAGDSVAFHTGARYLDPVDADTSEEVLTKNAKKFVLSGPNAMKATDLHSLIERTADWVAARENDPNQQGEVYETMVQQLRLLRKNVYGDEHHKLVAGLFNGKLMGLADLFRRTGTRPGDVAARALTRFDGIMRVFGASDATKGQKFETLRDNCIRVMGIEPQRLNELFYNDALWVAQTWQGSSKEFYEFLNQRYADSEYFQRPGASDALFSLLRSIPENNRYAMEKMKHSGADRVYDEQLGRERSHIETGLEGFTIPRNVNPVLRNWLSLFARKFAAGDAATNPFFEVDRLVATEEGVKILREGLNKLFDESGWTTFLRPLLTTELGGVPSPSGAEIHPKHIAGLLEKSGNDLVAFADAAFDKFGGADRNAYRADLVKWVNKTWSKLDSQFNPQKNDDTLSLGIPEIGINARVMTGPKEWFVFTQFTPGDQRRMTHGIAATGCFGRNGATLTKLAEDVKVALAPDVDEVNRLDNIGGWDELHKRDKAEWKRLMSVKKYVPSEWNKVLESTFNNEADFFVENRALMETFGTVVSGMTAGMKSALKNLITPSNMIYLQRSASLETMADVAGAYGKTGKIFLAALADCFGVRLFRNDPFVQALVREGVFDAATRTTVKDLATGERGVNDNLGSYARTLRQIRNVFVNTRLSPLSKDSMFPALRLLNPFQFTQIAVNMAGSWQLMQGYYEMADAAAQHYKNGGDRNKPLSAKDCGVSDDVRFNSLKAKLMDNGLTLEDLGQRLAKGQSILDRDFIQAVNNMSTGDLANEGGVNNRPLVMTRSRMGRVLGTFVGWQTAQTNHLLKLASDPQGRTNLLTLSRAAKVFALGMLPLSLAASAALDEWDELVDRKSNRRKIDLMDPQSISEALVAVGTTGMLGDALDYSINTAQGSSGNNDMLSLDNRIVLVNSARSVFNAVRNAIAMGDVNYANFGRPLLQGLGAGGIIQNAYLMDKVLHLRALPVIGEPFAAEHSVALRSNVGNYLRAAGRDIGLEVRRSGGGDYTPTPLTPHITNMYLAALSDDRETFQKEYQAAIKTAASMGKADPFKAVQQSFGSRHPLKSIFMSAPSAGEYQRLLGSMPDEGKAAVRDAVRLVNTYGASLGVDPFAGDETPQVRRAPIGLLDRLRSQLADDRVF